MPEKQRKDKSIYDLQVSTPAQLSRKATNIAGFWKERPRWDIDFKSVTQQFV
jgi:hypothetical protein